VVIDEAYVDFGARSCIPLIHKYPNLLVVHTLSKSRSLAGLRVGFACGNPALIEGLERVKNSFNSYPLDRLAIAGASASFEDDKYFRETTEQIVYNRDFLSKGLKKLGFQVLPSRANFVFASHELDAGFLKDELQQQSIFVRHFTAPRIDQCLRITVGTYKEIKLLLSALENILENV
jgi:histidinol-phosphate aminotransferase